MRKTGENIPCKNCNKIFYSRGHTKQKYCSSDCYWKSGQKRPSRLTGCNVDCLVCGHSFYSKKCEKRQYCSHKCYSESLKGKAGWNIGKKFPERSGKNHPRFKENKRDSGGYVLILMPEHPFAMINRYVFEHRLVVEKIIGRYLLPTEIVHHEGTKDDNRPQKLIAFTHKRFHNQFHADKKIDDCNIIFDGRKFVH